ncbi:hypothetical protein B0I35DRAFT_427512 [Stachybotrys elegans]|uniref:Uncharacterized protein n=1 Tax=Stachybotrys elegans TaxID=80388 RepID=A0A8K0SRD2_9HYPO|nr:hypothetical protein B0I35DRAFT_427512 [Stachybotrys elegans]
MAKPITKKTKSPPPPPTAMMTTFPKRSTPTSPMKQVLSPPPPWPLAQQSTQPPANQSFAKSTSTSYPFYASPTPSNSSTRPVSVIPPSTASFQITTSSAKITVGPAAFFTLATCSPNGPVSSSCRNSL